jgi:tetratricopeptide (TPR) repeat protein
LTQQSRTLAGCLATTTVLLLAWLPAAAVQGQAPLATADYELLLEDGEFLEAANVIKGLITDLLRDPRHDRMVYGQLLTELASAQLNGGEAEAALQNYQLAVGTIENARDRLHDGLVTPLLGLSRSYDATGRYTEAIRSYRQTLHVHEVNAGLHGKDKAKIIDELSEVYFKLGKFDEANAMQDWHVNLVERHHPGDDLARLESLYSRADMLARTDQNFRSAGAYRRIIALIERAEGPYSLELVPALSAISELLINNRIMDGEDGGEKAVRYLRRAVYISEKSTTAGIPVKADTQILMGDFLSQYTLNRDVVVRHYQRGWELLDSDVQYHERRDNLFRHTLLLNETPAATPPAMIDLLENAADASATKNGRIVVHYDVDAGGRPENIRVLESRPEGLHDYLVVNHVRRFAFRPRFADGRPAVTPNQVFELAFSYDERALDDEVRQNTGEVVSIDTID